MPATRSDLVTRVVQNTGINNQDTVIVTGLNEALKSIRQRGGLRDRWAKTTILMTAGQDYVALPTDFGKPQGVFIVDSDGNFLSPITLVHKAQAITIWPVAQSGLPCDAFIDGARLYLRPSPDTANMLTLHYFAKYAALDGDMDQAPNDEIEETLVRFATAHLFRTREDFDKAREYQALFEMSYIEYRRDQERQGSEQWVKPGSYYRSDLDCVLDDSTEWQW